jgi:hypothetical protein
MSARARGRVELLEGLPIAVRQHAPLAGIGHDDEVIAAVVAPLRCLHGDLKAFLYHRGIDWTRQIEALAYRARRGEHLVNGREVHQLPPSGVGDGRVGGGYRSASGRAPP